MSGDSSPSPQGRAGLLSDLVRQVRLCWQLLKHPKVPFWVKAVPVIAVIYILSPVDLLPDAILGLGQLDDLAVLVLGMELLVNLSPPAIVAALRHEIRYGRQPAGSAPESDGRTVEGDYRVVDDADRAMEDPRRR